MDTMMSKLRALQLAEPIYVIGMGASGRSALDFLREAGYNAIGLDEKVNLRRAEIRSFDDPEAFAGAGTLVVSPGVDRRRAAFTHSFAPQINDVEIFALLNDKPVLAVTGSNGKSTVVTLLAEALKAAGKNVQLCGNIGLPVLEAFFAHPDETDVYVLELSSYQLELCPNLRPRIGAVLNVSPDHLDRYDSFAAYAAAKENLVRQSSLCYLNGDDDVCAEISREGQTVVFYGFASKLANRVDEGEIFIHSQPVLKTDQLALTGKHNESNVLCALLMLESFGIEPETVIPTLKTFSGLAHRMQTVGEIEGVRYLDDSKATNIGATAAALAGLSSPVILIAGGVGKNQDFSALAEVIKTATVKKVLLIGVDNQDMEAAFSQANVDFEICGDLAHAVPKAREIATTGDVVLLSPATASFDQFDNYQQRGDAFAREVSALCL